MLRTVPGQIISCETNTLTILLKIPTFGSAVYTISIQVYRKDAAGVVWK